MDDTNPGKQPDPQAESTPHHEKRPYQAPKVEDFGSVSEVTASASTVMGMVETMNPGYPFSGT